MRTMIETLPNGFTAGNDEIIREIEFRKLDGEDEDLMLDKTELRKGDVLGRILKRGIVRLGSVTDPKEIGRLYDQYFLLADATFALIKLRIWGIDSNYSFEHKCPYCETIDKHVIDLSELPVDEQAEENRGKTDFLDTIEVQGTTYVVRHRPLYVRDQKMKEMINSNYGKEKATRELLLQLVELDGKRVEVKQVKKLYINVRNALRKLMDSKMGGIDMDLTNDCGKCNNSYKTQLPVDIKSFFFQVGDSSNMRMAQPFRVSGTTLAALPPDSDGSPAKFDS